jgi:hypothetical protein
MWRYFKFLLQAVIRQRRSVGSAESFTKGIELSPQLKSSCHWYCLPCTDNPFHNFEHASHVTMFVTVTFLSGLQPTTSPRTTMVLLTLLPERTHSPPRSCLSAHSCMPDLSGFQMTARLEPRTSPVAAIYDSKSCGREESDCHCIGIPYAMNSTSSELLVNSGKILRPGKQNVVMAYRY